MSSRVAQNAECEKIQEVKTVPVWDVATRLFHWALVLLIILAYATNKAASWSLIGFQWHKINGYAILALLLFRVLWGLFGSSTSRFSNFVRPFKVIGYLARTLAGKAQHYLGHNPAGAMMIVLLLVAVAAQALSGLFTADDLSLMLFAGPFAGKVSESSAEMAGAFHRIGFYIILALVCVHVITNIAYAAIRRDGMIRAMVTGRKKADRYVDAPYATFVNQFWAVICLLVAFAVVFGALYYWGDAPFV